MSIVLIGAVNSAISLFYYLNLVRMSYSRESEGGGVIELAFHEKALCCLFNVFIIYLGIMPFGLLGLFRSAL